MTHATPDVYRAISDVSADLARGGISKNRNNDQQNYSFRGIDDVYNSLASLLPKHGLVILPRITNRSVVERKTQKGTTIFYVTVEAEFTLVSCKDGSSHTIKMYGEAMDTADKATNKAMSAAYKYAALQVFCIPTEGDNDTENSTHEVVPADPWTKEIAQAAAESASHGMAAYTEWWKSMSDDFRRAAVKTSTHADMKALASEASVVNG